MSKQQVASKALKKDGFTIATTANRPYLVRLLEYEGSSTQGNKTSANYLYWMNWLHPSPWKR